MVQLVDIAQAPTLEEYGQHLHLAQIVADLRRHVASDVATLQRRKIWMLNSTADGGGVAEMLPKVVSLLRDLGLDTEWIVVGPDDDTFFQITKRLHNLLHGSGDDLEFRPEERSLYASISREAAALLAQRMHPDDIIVVHDPQPLGAGAILKKELGLHAIWRCHVGHDAVTPQTEAAWTFLKEWVLAYDRCVFTFPEYVPSFVADRAEIISPAIDPLSDKNRDLSIRKVAGVLINAHLDGAAQPVVTPPFETPAMRLQPDGAFAPANEPDPIGLLHRPIVTQISRWDRLKGWAQLLKGFEILKTSRGGAAHEFSEQHHQRLDLVRLVLAGPDPDAIQDDPEGLEVFDALRRSWLELPASVQKDVVFLVLPMGSRRNNALMVNALQRCSTVVVQNSIREGFGLTVTEAMWKRRPVLGTIAVGIRNQVRDGVDGRLVNDPEDPSEVASLLNEMLAAPHLRNEWAQNGQRRVADEFLIFEQVRRWLHVMASSAPSDAIPQRSTNL